MDERVVQEGDEILLDVLVPHPRGHVVDAAPHVVPQVFHLQLHALLPRANNVRKYKCLIALKKEAVFRIRDIVVRIRILGFVPLTNGSGSCYFRQ